MSDGMRDTALRSDNYECKKETAKDWKLIAERQEELIKKLTSIMMRSVLQNKLIYDINDVADYCTKWDNISLLESQEVEGGSAEEIIKGHISCTCDVMYKTRKMTDPNCVLCEYGGEIELMMEEYAQQSSKVTDDDIEKWADKISNNNFSCSTANLAKYAAMVGAKAMRDGVIKKI